MKLRYPVIVEGKYDKIKLASIIESTVITTDGFSIFNKEEKLSLIRQLAKKSKIILLTDSDGAGHLIRSHIKTALNPEQIINLYTPRVEGKEKRKRSPSKEGYLGVEGTDIDILKKLLEPFSCDSEQTENKNPITKKDLYVYGLSGQADSSAKRGILLKSLDLPEGMSANAMLSAINILYSREEIATQIEKVL
jgi:ribonuclease M5